MLSSFFSSDEIFEFESAARCLFDIISKENQRNLKSLITETYNSQTEKRQKNFLQTCNCILSRSVVYVNTVPAANNKEVKLDEASKH